MLINHVQIHDYFHQDLHYHEHQQLFQLDVNLKDHFPNYHRRKNKGILVFERKKIVEQTSSVNRSSTTIKPNFLKRS